jgi:hypothetical protein
MKEENLFRLFHEQEEKKSSKTGAGTRGQRKNRVRRPPKLKMIHGFKNEPGREEAKIIFRKLLFL